VSGLVVSPELVADAKRIDLAVNFDGEAESLDVRTPRVPDATDIARREVLS